MGLLNDITAAAWSVGVSTLGFLRPKAQRGTGANQIAPRIVFMPRTPAGVFINPDEALKISVVWACATVIAKAISSSAWEVFSEDASGDRELRRDIRLWRILNVHPNPEMTAFAFREAALIQALIWGNFYAEIERSTRGEPLALWPLDPERCKLERNPETQRLQVRVSNATFGQVAIPYRDIFHLHGPSIDGIEGLNVWAYASRTFGHAAALEIFGSTFFGNNATFGGFLVPEGYLNQTQVDQILDDLRRGYQGPEKAHKWMVLRGGMKAESAGTIPRDAQFTESRQHQVEEICRFFGVPPHKVAHLLRSTFNNIEHQGLEFVRDALTPWAERMRQEADVKLMPFGNRLLRTRFDLDWLAEGDAESKARADAQLVQNGLMSRDEVRRRRAMNVRGGAADMLTVQIQNVDIESLNNPPEAPLGAPAIGQQVNDEEHEDEESDEDAAQD